MEYLLLHSQCKASPRVKDTCMKRQDKINMWQYGIPTWTRNIRLTAVAT